MLKDDHKIMLNMQDLHFLNLCTTKPNFVLLLLVVDELTPGMAWFDLTHP